MLLTTAWPDHPIAEWAFAPATVGPLTAMVGLDSGSVVGVRRARRLIRGIGGSGNMSSMEAWQTSKGDNCPKVNCIVGYDAEEVVASAFVQHLSAGVCSTDVSLCRSDDGWRSATQWSMYIYFLMHRYFDVHMASS